ncbi:MAG: heme exporter protein CcmD [Pseudomonadota bacterium]
MTELFGERYFSFIASSYAVTSIVLLAMLAWVIVTHRSRQSTLAKLEAAGVRRASKEAELQARKKERSQ